MTPSRRPVARDLTIQNAAGTLTQNTGGGGVDRLSGVENLNGANNWSDLLIGDGAANVLNGYGFHDDLRGAGGADTLIGGNGNDALNGGADGDRLTGGLGRDTLTGGAGVDRFVFAAMNETTADAATADRITDYASGDIVDLSALDANGAGAGNPMFTRVANDGAFTAAGQMRLTLHGADTWLELNTDGDAVADAVVVLTGVHNQQGVESGWAL